MKFTIATVSNARSELASHVTTRARCPGRFSRSSAISKCTSGMHFGKFFCVQSMRLAGSVVTAANLDPIASFTAAVAACRPSAVDKPLPAARKRDDAFISEMRCCCMTRTYCLLTNTTATFTATDEVELEDAWLKYFSQEECCIQDAAGVMNTMLIVVSSPAWVFSARRTNRAPRPVCVSWPGSLRIALAATPSSRQ